MSSSCEDPFVKVVIIPVQQCCDGASGVVNQNLVASGMAGQACEISLEDFTHTRHPSQGTSVYWAIQYCLLDRDTSVKIPH